MGAGLRLESGWHQQLLDCSLGPRRKKATDMADEKKNGLWHEHNPLFRVRLTDGTYSRGFGQIYRRWKANKWEYRQDEETDEEYNDRQY